MLETNQRERRRMIQKVKECMMVTIEFSVRTTTRDDQRSELPPRTRRFVYGVDARYPSFEKALAGRKPGERITVRVPLHTKQHPAA